MINVQSVWILHKYMGYEIRGFDTLLKIVFKLYFSWTNSFKFITFETHLFKVYSDIGVPIMPRLSYIAIGAIGLHVKILKAILSTSMLASFFLALTF